MRAPYWPTTRNCSSTGLLFLTWPTPNTAFGDAREKR